MVLITSSTVLSVYTQLNSGSAGVLKLEQADWGQHDGDIMILTDAEQELTLTMVNKEW